ncbi:RMtype1_S_SonII-TRD2-CR2_like domain containing protein [Comamonadaceae bacterium]
MTTLDTVQRHEIPNSWEWRKLGDICDVTDRDHRTPSYQEHGVPLISPKDFTEHGVDLSRLKHVALEELTAFVKKCKPEIGDILYSRIGTIGEARLVDFDLKFVALHSIAMVKPRLPGLMSKFVLYLLQSPAIRSKAKHNIKSVGTPDLGLTRIRDFEVPVPPTEVQKEIVAEIEKQFSRLDEAVANLRRVKANLKRYKASVLKAAVEGRLVETEATLASREGRTYETGEQLLQRVLLARPDQWSARGRYVEPLPAELKDLSPLPDGWIWASIDQLSDFITKGTTPAATKLFDGSGDVQFLKVYNLTFDGSLNHTHKPAYVSRATHKDELARSQVFPGDVLINIVGPPLGQVSVVPARVEEANINQAIARIRPIKPLSSDFISIALMCDGIMRWAIRRGKTTAGQANLTLELCRALPVPVPPLAEQARIVAEVDRHLSIIREVEAEVDANLQRAQALRQATLAAAFAPDKTTGRSS